MDDLIREMIAPKRRSDLDRGRRSRLVATATTVGLAALGLTTLTTGALFTDQDTVPGAITAGTVDIASTGNLDVTLALNGGFAPGDGSLLVPEPVAMMQPASA